MIINANLPEAGLKPSPIYRQSVEQTQYCKLLQSSIAIFQKPYEHRTAIQVAMISKLVQKINLFKAVEMSASTDTVKSLIRFGKIVRLAQHKLVCEEAAFLDCFVVALVGKFGSVAGTSESITIAKDEQAYAHYLNDFKNFTPKHLQFLKKKQLRLPKPFKAPKVNPSQFDVKTSLQANLDNELLFTGQHQFLTPLQVKKYPQTIITLAQENYLFEIDFKKLCELLREEHAKALLKQVQIFSNFDCFKLFKKQKLKQMVEQLHVLKLKKDQVLFSQGQPDRRIFILTKGQISLERFAALGHQNPNNLYKNRLSIKRSEHKNRTRDKISAIPFADFSKVYNASTELKKVKLTRLSPISIFGEEEVIAQTERETTAKVTSYGAEIYVFTVEQISRYFTADSQYKVGDFLQVLGQEITEKKILYRQEKFGGEVDYLNRNSKNGFYITEDVKTSPRGKRAITNINKTIPVRVEPKWVEEEEDSKMFLTATFNCHNFQEFYESRKAKNHPKQPQLQPYPHKQQPKRMRLSAQEKQILKLLHGNERTVMKSAHNSRQKSQRKSGRFAIDLDKPLFTPEYFKEQLERSRKIQKEMKKSKLKNLYSSNQSFLTTKSRTLSVSTAKQKNSPTSKHKNSPTTTGFRRNLSYQI